MDNTYRGKIDDDGLIILPEELLENLGWEVGDKLEISTSIDGDHEGPEESLLIVLKKV